MRKILPILALLLLASSLMVSTLPLGEAKRSGSRTIDGNPSDWTGTPPATDNTWLYDSTAGEWIWRDTVGDDKGNGTYTYPTAYIVSWGINRTAFSPGDFDLKEFRMAWNETTVFFLLSFVNITDNEGWGVGAGNEWITSPIEADTTAVAICIDTDRVNGSGYDVVDTQADGLGSVRADILLPPSCYWEYMIEICLGDIVLWYYDGLFVTEAYRNFPIAANNATYKTIEFAVPIDTTGVAGLPDPENETWALFAFVGSQDFEHFREVASTEVATANPWAPGGGEGPYDANAIGPDPDAFDCAFFETKAKQEDALNGFTATDFAVMPPNPPLGPSYREIPEFPLPFTFALIAAIILVASFKMRKKLYL